MSTKAKTQGFLSGSLMRLRSKLITLTSLLWFRVSVCFILGITLPLLSFATFTLLQTRNTLYETTNRFSHELIGEISRNILREINLLQVMSINIAYDDVVQHLSANYSELSHAELHSALGSARTGIAHTFAFFREFTDVILYPLDEGGVTLYGNPAIPFRLAPENETRLINEAIRRNGRLAIFAFGPQHQIAGLRLQQDLTRDTAECLMIVRAIRSLRGGDILGVLALRLDARFFNEPLRNLNLGEGVQFMTFYVRGDTILSTNEALFSTGKPVPYDFLAQIDNDASILNINFSNENYIAYIEQINEVEWTSVLLVPRENLDSELRSVFYIFLITLVLALVFSVLLIQIFHRLFNRPMIRLVDAMNAADSGSLHVEVASASSDEIGQATRSFNNMLARIRQLLEDVKAKETAKRSAELAALQAQINPHFLSNTLTTARLLAQKQKADNIDELLAALIDLLRVSMDVSNKMITLREEIKYVQSYVDIMQYKSYAKIDIQYHIQKESEDCLVPRLILQPLVENALTHGLTEVGMFGQIDVRAVIDSDVLNISVTDNGSGITPEKISDIMNASPEDTKTNLSGIGLPNVHERIQRHFGESFGLSIDSFPKVFTTIAISLPITKEKDGDADGRQIDSSNDR